MSIILTSDKEIFIKIVKAIFLGNWCRKDKKLVCKKKNIIFTQKNNFKELKKQFILETRVYEKILKELSYELNKIHNKNFSLRAWRIIIGPWLNRFITVIFDRKKIIDDFLGKRKKKKISFSQTKVNHDVAFDTDDFTNYSSSDKWNNYIFLRIISLKLNLNKLKFVGQRKLKKIDMKFNLKNIILNIFNNFSKKNCTIILHNTYLGKKNIIKLIFQLKKIPYISNFGDEILQKSNMKKLRNKLNLISSKKKYPKNEILLRKLIPENIPSVFIENFENLEQTVSNLNLSNKKKTIFCSNGLYKNEILKYCTANEVEKGGKLICGQHGGTYGISNFSYAEDHEKKISNKFLSWGWKDLNNKKVIPYSSFKILNRKKVTLSKNNKILIVLNRVGRFLMVNQSERVDWSTAESYSNFILKFLNKIPKKMRKRVFIKTYPMENEYLNPLKPIIKKKFKKEFNFIKNRKKLKYIIKDFKLVILTNNNTCHL